MQEFKNRKTGEPVQGTAGSLGESFVVQTGQLPAGGSCQKVSTSTVSAQSAVINSGRVEITPSVDTYVRAGLNPTALNTGVDHLLLGGFTHSFYFTPGEKLAFILASGTGTVHISPVE